jgi:hypothetical protein
MKDIRICLFCPKVNKKEKEFEKKQKEYLRERMWW